MIIFAAMLFIAMGVTGVYATAHGESFGVSLVFLAMIGPGSVKLIVDYTRGGNAPLDERELSIKWKSLALGAIASCMLVALWAIFLGAFADDGMWHPSEPSEWQAVGLFMIGNFLQTSIIAEEWMTSSYSGKLLE